MTRERANPMPRDPGNKWFAIIGLSLVAVVLIAWLIWLVSGQMTTHYRHAPASLQDNVICPQAGEIKDERYYQSSLAPATGFPGSVPAGFIPVYAVDCGPGYGQSIDPVYLTGDFTPLLSQLAQESDRRYSRDCPANLVLAPNLWFVNRQHQAIQVIWPIDACNQAKLGNSDVLEHLVSASTPPSGFAPAVQP